MKEKVREDNYAMDWTYINIDYRETAGYGIYEGHFTNIIGSTYILYMRNSITMRCVYRGRIYWKHIENVSSPTEKGLVARASRFMSKIKKKCDVNVLEGETNE